MVEEPPNLTAKEGASEQFQTGDRVRIVLGALTGLVGVVVRRTLNHKYLLKVDDLPTGVHVVVSALALERVALA